MVRLIVLMSALLTLGCRPPAGSPSSPPDGSAGSAILESSDLPPVQGEPIPGDPMAVTVHRLSNGMTVYISPNPEQPVVDAWVVVRAGSRHDPADSTGLAHYLEHMLFKGTDELGTLDIEREQPHLERIAALYDQLREPQADAEAIRAQIDAQTQASTAYVAANEQTRLYGLMGFSFVNAYTSIDHTAYIATVPANRIAQWAQVEAERFANPRFRLFQPELEVVYEEKNLSLDDANDGADAVMAAALFPRHPYGTQTILGSIDHLKTPAYGDMVEFHRRWYVPNNMAIVLAGDVTPDVIEVLEEHFSRLEPRALEDPSPAPLHGPRGHVEVPYVSKSSRGVRLAWRAAPQGHADEPTLSLLDSVLDNSRSGLLNVELELTQTVPNAGSYYRPYAEAGHVVVWAEAHEDQSLDELESLLLGVVARAKADEVEPQQLEAIKLAGEIADKRALESNFARVQRMTRNYVQRRSWADALDDQRRRSETTPEQIIDVAQRYLGDDMVVLRREKGERNVPRLSKPAITPVEIDYSRRSNYAQALLDQPLAPLEPQTIDRGTHYTEHSTPAGPIVAVPNPHHDLFELRYVVNQGLRREPLLCHALSLWELSGSADHSPAVLKDQLYRLGTRVSTECDADRSTLVITGIDRHMDQSLAVIRSWLATPRVDATVAAQLQRNVTSERRDRLDNAEWLAWALWNYALLGEHSPELAQPSNTDIERAEPASLLALVSGWLDHRHRTHYFGPRSGSKTLSSTLAMGQDHIATASIEPRRVRTPAATTVLLVHQDVAKASISVFVPITSPPRRPVAIALAEYYGGQATTLFASEIREARGLAYHASGSYLLPERPVMERRSLPRPTRRSTRCPRCSG